MSEYTQFVVERDRIDELIEKGFTIHWVKENLSGAFVEFRTPDGEVETLHVKTAEGRKYFSNLFIKQKMNA